MLEGEGVVRNWALKVGLLGSAYRALQYLLLMALCSMSHSVVCTTKLVVMLLTFQHLLLLGVLSLSRPSEYRLNLEIKAANAYNTSGTCGGMHTLETQNSKN